MAHFIVQCENVKQFAYLTMQYTRNGYLFKADGASLTIELTGGY